MQYVTFFATILFTLVLSHAFIYVSLVQFFEPMGVVRKILLSVVIVLSISFIASSLLAHWYDNPLTRGLYFVSATWLGVLSNLFFAFLLAWMVFFLVRLFGVRPPVSVLGSFAILLAVAASLYGLYAANSIIVRSETVFIRDLPASWEGKKIVQVNDVHIGHIIREPFTSRMTQIINDQNPDLVAIVGDLFDGMDGNLQGLVKPLENIKSDYGTYFITWNHETYLGTGIVMDILKETNIRTIDDVLVDLDGLQLIGVASPERRKERDLHDVFSRIGFDPKRPSILLYHTPTEIATAKSLGVSLQLAGHTHRGQLYPYNLITKKVFAGYDYWIYSEWDYTLSVSSGVGTWGPPMRTNSRSEIVVLTLRRR